MYIRNIEQRDDAAIKTIIRQSLAEFGLDVPGTAYFDPQLGNLSAFYAGVQGAYFVACDDSGHVIGGAGYAPIGDGQDISDNYHGIAELQKLYVSEESRGSGASYRLIEHIEHSAQQHGFTTLYLETHHALEAAMHVYERLGFQPIDGPLGDAQHTTMDRFYTKVIA
ncbi:GNAT family N-acetyltransferase [Bifidobacterium sp.]|jgi:putative acetyltransferase|uniref:GNAT family N-acetyltransferase n=1 Tax=Bifidobacterium sp. TaxID=41200 RepID=UPI0025BE51C3|nr:GNAT family N-acetyltransferase [Bifidobacterium sp.]MCI1636324.1 GNAT family N-acetyltransferase [Bifidobacterium sp.]